MSLMQKTLRLSLAAALLGSLGACTVVPAYPVGYHRAPPVYVEPYPAYGHPSTTIYYQSGQRHYDDRNRHSYREERRPEPPRRVDSPFDNAARTHRDVRRSLGLPRLPGMP